MDVKRLESSIAPNTLDREFTATAPNQKCVADFTYVWTTEGWLYVAGVLDLFSRRIVGWSMKSRMTADLVTDALIMAIWRRRPDTELLYHSDQGSPIHGGAVPEAPRGQRHRVQHEPFG